MQYEPSQNSETSIDWSKDRELISIHPLFQDDIGEYKCPERIFKSHQRVLILISGGEEKNTQLTTKPSWKPF